MGSSEINCFHTPVYPGMRIIYVYYMCKPAMYRYYYYVSVMMTTTGIEDGRAWPAKPFYTEFQYILPVPSG
jgi:hypothetical protein